MGAPLWEPLTRGNPSQALRVPEVLVCSTYLGGGENVYNDLGVW